MEVRTVVFAPAAQRQFLKLTVDIRRRIEARLAALAELGTGDVKRLKGRSGLRLRIGDWRVIYHDAGDTIIVAAVGHRRGIYE